MPLVRVGVRGSAAESFDTFDVAEMTYNQQAPRNWSSPQRVDGGSTATATTTARHAKPCIPTSAETEDLTSLDSSSGRRSEETDRIDTVMPLYDTMDNLDEMHHDPRNPFNKSQSTRRSWGADCISEEDEISLSTMGDSSVTPTSSMQQQPYNYLNNSRSNSQQMHQFQNRSHRHRQKNRPSYSSTFSYDLEDFSVASHQSESTRKVQIGDNRSISQLEAQVMKLNFELATTKASLDELKLENRRLNDDKSALSNDINVMQHENEQLHLKIERLEKEKILRNMEGTKGVARRPTIDRESHSVWGGATVSGNTLAGENNARATSSNRKYMHAVTGSLEVPFRGPDVEFRVRPKRLSNTSFASSDELSDGGDMNSAHSIIFGDTDNNLDSSEDIENDELEKMAHIVRGSLLNMIGVGKRPPVGDMTKQMQEISISSQSNGHNAHITEETLFFTESLTSSRQDNYKDVAGDNDSGSNPHSEDLNDEDPFATWSVPGDRKRIEPEQNWIQRGLGGFGKERKISRQNPQSNEDVEEIIGSSNEDDYTSFADKFSVATDASESAHDRKKFGLFKGFGRQR
jgi:hypothetical protein